MKKSVLLLLALTACGMNEYRPAVANIKDQGKYEADTKECIQYSKDVRSKFDERGFITGGLGAVGYLGLQATKDADDPYFKDGYRLTDECMAKKGYTLVNVR